MIGVFVLLAGLQYKWQLQVAEADREKMQRRIETDAARFAEDFNTEIQAAYFNFQIGADAWRSGDHGAFNDRYDHWRSKTEYPDLIKGFYYLDNKSDSVPLKYEFETRRFIPADADASIEEIRTRIEAKNAGNVFDDLNAMVLPVHDNERRRVDRIFVAARTTEVSPVIRMPESVGSLVILLDRDTITQKILPELSQRYFPDGEFTASVTDKSGVTVFGTAASADASVSLFNLSPEKFMMFAGRDDLPSALAERQPGVMVNRRVESVTRTESKPRGKADVGTFKIELQQSGEQRPRTQIFTGTRMPEDPWKLGLTHRDGSIGAYIDSSFRRGVATGGGLLALLAVAVLGIFFSAQRAKMLARRQLEFVSSVSHEFRTPLAVIYSAGENLADGVAKEDEQVSRYGQLIKGEGRKLSAMVEQILEFAGANSGKQKYKFTETDIAAVIDDAVDQCRPIIESGGFTVETDIQKPLTAAADRQALVRAVQNLIANSVKYSSGEKWMRISAQNGRSIRISIEDRGIGIAKSDLKHIFEPFYRARSVVDAQIHGNGLGLSLVKQTAEAHGGTATAESEHGKGSKFTIELPAGDRYRRDAETRSESKSVKPLS